MMPNETIKAVMYIAPGLLAGLALLVGYVLFAAGMVGERPDSRRREGSFVIPATGIDFFYWLADSVVGRLAEGGLRPNHITVMSLVVGVMAAVAFGAGYFMLGTWLLFVAGLGDVLDGLLARRYDMASEAGAFLDSLLDRVTEAVVFTGLAVWGGGGAMTWLAIWAFVASFCVSYARARGDSLGVDCAQGLMQRGERLFLLIVFLFLSPIVDLFVAGPAAGRHLVATLGVAVVAALSTVTAINRARWIMSALEDSEIGPESSQNAGESRGVSSGDTGAVHP